MIPYVSLHNHSTFSILDSLAKPLDLMEKAKSCGQTAIGITDHGSMAAAWDSLQASKKTGVKLIIGSEMYFTDDLNNTLDTRLRHIVLLAKNHVGYKNLLALQRKAYDNALIKFKRAIPRVDWNLLEDYSDGVICLTACGQGILSQLIMENRADRIRETAIRLKNIYGDDLALELQPHNLTRKENQYSGPIDQRKINLALKNLSHDLDIRCVVATDAHYINKEDHEAMEVLLAIGSGQTIDSGQRLNYNVSEFYVKNAIEIAQHFFRHRPMWIDRDERFIEKLFENTVYLADKCEAPDWIDPAMATGRKTQLPKFKYEDEPDYCEFKKWKDDKQSVFFKEGLDDESLFYRFRTEKGLNAKIGAGILSEKDRNTCNAKCIEEFDVLEHRKFSGYMLISAEFLGWCRKNNISVGPGRGCTTSDTLVLTDNGYRQISQINGGDRVYSHNGTLQNVTCSFKYSSADVIGIKTVWAYGISKYTSDHLVFSTKQIGEALNWVPASSLEVGDFVYTPWVERIVKDVEKIDLSNFVQFCTRNKRFAVKDKEIEIADKNIIHDLSIREISRSSGIHFGNVQKEKNNIKTKYREELCNFIQSYCGISFEKWIGIKHSYIINRFINIDNDFCYLLGRWVGDGCFHGKTKGITIAFNTKKDASGIDRVKGICEKLFGRVCITKGLGNCTYITVCSELVFRLFYSIFPNYHSSSDTKSFPSFFRNLNDDLLRALLCGYFDADGSHCNHHEKVKTVSEQLALEVKEALLLLKIPSSIVVEPFPVRNGVTTKTSYSVCFLGFSLNRRAACEQIDENGYYSKVVEISNLGKQDVFDISVNNTHSYLTCNFSAHNSVGGSLTAFLNDIHKTNPIKYGLLFARFLNKYKDNPPDIDNDIASSGRGRLFEYLSEKYGADNIASVSNYSTITPKVYARDIARVFNFGGDKKESVKIGNDIADSIPNSCHSVVDALDQAPLFGEYAKKYPELHRFAKLIGGKPRAWATHAAGIVICDHFVHSLVPVRKDTSGNICLEYEKERTEDNGLVKIDVLGVDVHDVISDTCGLIRQNNKTPPIINDFDYDAYDEKTYDLISSGNVFGVFQLAGVATNVCKLIKPRSVGDIALISSLIRPASKEIIPDFIKVRNGEKSIELIHPLLSNALVPTNGYGLFEESLLILAADFCGWDLHEADSLRKMTKQKGKYPEKVKELQRKFINDAIANGVKQEDAEKVWTNVVSVFGTYAFNKSHATSYSQVSFHTAYLKANFTIEFLVALLMAEVNKNTKKSPDNILRIKSEIRQLGIKIIPPDINSSSNTYKIVDDKTLMTGLDQLKFLKDESIEHIIENRPYKDWDDFVERAFVGKVNAAAIRSLASCGALDCFGISRKLLVLYSADYRDKRRAWAKKKPEKRTPTFEYPWPEEVPWANRELFALEKHFMGEGLSGTVFDRYEPFFKEGIFRFADLPRLCPYRKQDEDAKMDRKKNTVHLQKLSLNGLKAVILQAWSFKVGKEDSPIFGQEMARLTLQDPWGTTMQMLVFPEAWVAAQDRVKELSGGKSKIEDGLAIHFTGLFQWEGPDNYSFVLTDILNFKGQPEIPKDDLKGKKIKMPTAKGISKEKAELLTEDELEDQIEDEMINNGFSNIDEEDDDPIPDPFGRENLKKE